jgi:hypothetical protein
MQTFVAAREFVSDSQFDAKREKALRNLDLATIDPPIVDIIEALAEISYCYTLQSCWGHFVHEGQPDPRGCEPLANYNETTTGRFQLAYIALCLENSPGGLALRDDLRSLVNLDPHNVQFGSAGWFWKRYVNTYVVQVEPERFKTRDRANIGINEALYLEKLKAKMFSEMRNLLSNHLRNR